MNKTLKNLLLTIWDWWQPSQIIQAVWRMDGLEGRDQENLQVWKMTKLEGLETRFLNARRCLSGKRNLMTIKYHKFEIQPKLKFCCFPQSKYLVTFSMNFLNEILLFGSLALSKYLVGSLMNGLQIHYAQGKQVQYK